MASLRRRAGGWDLRYRERSGRQRTERFQGGTARTPPEAALDRKAEVELELRRGRYVPRERREVAFADYYLPWAAARQISRSRRFTDDQRAAKHVIPYWGQWPICDIKPSDIDDWVAALSRSMGPQSVRACYGLLRGPLRRAVKDRVIDDPCIDIGLPKLPSLRKSFDDVLTAQEVDRLVAALVDPDPRYAALRTNGRYEALIFMGAWLGPRWNEAIGLRICDVNPLRKELTLGRVVVNQNGSHTYVEALSKTEDSRTVPVPSEVMDRLIRHQRLYCAGADREDFLFTSNRGTHILRGTFSRDVLAKAVKRAGPQGRRITWLTLRHTAASLMFDAGLTIFEVQQRLGHKSPTLTAEIYTHLMRERFQEGRERMEVYMAIQRVARPSGERPAAQN
ncbi:MAG TPA: tyrosine-type recombinase/integrase [Actinomycetes bacterium]|nr:tyrosine-type recombinase/integrase [Actinomycetes bacterium]